MLAAATTQPELCYTPQVTSSTTKDHLRIWENGCIRNQYEFGPRCEMDLTHSLLLFSSSLADNKSFIISHRHACSSQHVPSDTQPCPASGSDRPTERVSEVNEFESESPKLHQSVQRPLAYTHRHIRTQTKAHTQTQTHTGCRMHGDVPALCEYISQRRAEQGHPEWGGQESLCSARERTGLLAFLHSLCHSCQPRRLQGQHNISSALRILSGGELLCVPVSVCACVSVCVLMCV